MPDDKQSAGPKPVSEQQTADEKLMAKAQATDAGAKLSANDKRDLQGMAHGGETHGNTYGAGPGHPYADPAQADGDPKPGDSASKVASAQTTRKSDRARKQGVV